MLKSTATVSAVILAGLVAVGCASRHEEGVRSNYRTQWTPVAADTRAATRAAEAVFNDEGLKDVKATSTNVDGKVTGKKADGTVVTANIEKAEEGTGSQVSVTVGTIGDPSLGAEIAKRIKEQAGGAPPATTRVD